MRLLGLASKWSKNIPRLSRDFPHCAIRRGDSLVEIESNTTTTLAGCWSESAQRRKPRGAATTTAAAKATQSPRKAKAEAAAQAAAEAAEHLERREMAKALSEGGRTVAAKSWKDMIQGVDAMAAAEAVANSAGWWPKREPRMC